MKHDQGIAAALLDEVYAALWSRDKLGKVSPYEHDASIMLSIIAKYGAGDEQALGGNQAK